MREYTSCLSSLTSSQWMNLKDECKRERERVLVNRVIPNVIEYISIWMNGNVYVCVWVERGMGSRKRGGIHTYRYK